MGARGRAARLGKRIGEIVATGIDHEVKDPRLEFVTITDSRLTADLRDATVYYTVRGESLDDEPDHDRAARALEGAKGQLRTLVGRQTGVKFTPSLTFVPDSVPDAARHMEELLAKARESDAELRRSSEGAVPAGDANPYRSDADETPGADESENSEAPEGETGR